MHSQGDVYAKIIEEVVTASSNDFEESGVSSTTLSELQQVRFMRPRPPIVFSSGSLSSLRLSPCSTPTTIEPLRKASSQAVRQSCRAFCRRDVLAQK